MRSRHPTHHRTLQSLAIAAALLAVLLSPVTTPARQAEPEAIAGTYDGSQTEMAARLELGEDGRYQYLLSYGAVDEFSAGTWIGQEGGVVLTSDPANAPRFEMLGAEPGTGPQDKLTIRLEGTGNLPLSLFGAIVERGDGSSFTADFSDEGLAIPVSEGEQITSVSLALPMFEVRGEPVAVAQAAGNTLYFAFRPNDLGFKAFDHAVLPESEGVLLLERFGRDIAFRRIAD